MQLIRAYVAGIVFVKALETSFPLLDVIVQLLEFLDVDGSTMVPVEHGNHESTCFLGTKINISMFGRLGINIKFGSRCFTRNLLHPGFILRLEIKTSTLSRNHVKQ